MIQVALLSKWHVHAVDYAKEATENPSINIKTIWDEDPARGESWAQELGVDFNSDLENVLSDPEIDAFIVSTPTNLHTDVIRSAANHGKHIFTEKVLAFSTRECEEIFKDIEESGVQFMISLPRLTKDYYLYAQQVVDQALLGSVTMMRCRVAHNGAVPTEKNQNGWLPDRFYNEEQCGGGALIDLGAHPIYLANRLMGKPEAISSRLPQMRGLGVDDQAVALLDYASGAMAVLETSFVSTGSPFQLELYGTQGTLLIEDDTIRLKSSKLDSDDWTQPENVPEDLPMPMEQWASAIEQNQPVSITKEDAYLLTLVNEAAALSHKEGRRVDVKEFV
ncbi:Gfo/Idh/MocA family oxidoreductase [Halobacillus locisalis]|uniref:Gfo/Idh/MocA family oxidoreductase n=1 Tax=Halobacillus locisalis TaxID=220753 RepID=A0A838CXK2_9BACI|nr:Gfo/Idh/MocA family oxidoreductase [Halobacillus locisalis]MBA2176336.1 Gfo/Idh/MocA family oxidoreductase [Halobacillus locisalis]